MSGPWENYAPQAAEADNSAPWTKYAKPAQPYDPTSDMGTVDRLVSGIGMGAVNIGRALGQAGRGIIETIAPPTRTLNDLVTGAPGHSFADTLGLPNQASIDEAARLDAPLNATTAGRVGGVIGNVAAVLPVARIPGANTVAGAAAIGAATGLATTPGDINERLKGAGYGAAGGAAGQVVGRALGAGSSAAADWLAQRASDKAAANAGRLTAVQTAKDAGYVLPPTAIKPGVVSSVLEGLSGKIKTSQAASQTNQTVTNRLAAESLGAPTDIPLTVQALQTIRDTAGKAYDAIGSTGTITPTRAYSDALDKIAEPAVKAAQGFPASKASPVIDLVESLRSPQFDASSAIAKIKELRATADDAFRTGNTDLGRAAKQAAGALENAVDTHLQGLGQPQLLDQFRNARQTIAKTYTVQKALNDSTGDVSAQSLGAQLAKGKPLSGNLEVIGKVNQAFPKATQALKQDYNALSPLDFMAGMIGHSADGITGAGAALVRPIVRKAILSSPAQSAFASSALKPTGPGAIQTLANLGKNNPQAIQSATTLAGLLTALKAAQQ